MNIGIIANNITKISHRRRVDRREPQAINAQQVSAAQTTVNDATNTVSADQNLVDADQGKLSNDQALLALLSLVSEATPGARVALPVAVSRVAERIANVEIVIARKVGETEALYGSVTSSDIAEALAAKGFDLDRRKIALQEPIKKLGEYDIPVKLQREVTMKLKVRVVAEGGVEKQKT